MSIKRKNWKTEYDRCDRTAQELAQKLGVHEIVAVLLCNRGMKTVEQAREFIYPAQCGGDPFLLPDMERSVNIITEALAAGEKIAVYGDYDVDGVTSTAALYLYLKGAGANVTYYIPNRNGAGYGVNREAIDLLKEQGCTLIVTVDTGTTAVDETEYAKEQGMKIVVTDHHDCHGRLPDAPVVNPKRADSAYGFAEFAGVGVVFKLLCALEMKRCGVDCEEATRRMIQSYGDLAAVGTVADVMPLVAENRSIVSEGFAVMKRNMRPCFEAILNSGDRKVESDRITTYTVSFNIAPKLNAAGRLADASLAVALLLSKGMTEAVDYASRLLELNCERRQEESNIFKEAVEMIENECDLENDRVIVLSKKGWHHGVIGVVAARITDKYGLPSILISFDENGVGKGSGRSVKGLNLSLGLAHCSELLIKHGGHELAAGLSVARERFDDFKKALNEYAKENMSTQEEPYINAECELDPSEITLALAEELPILEPYGTGNPSPLFVLRDAAAKEVVPVGDGSHTRFVFEKDGRNMSGIFFNAKASELDFAVGDSVDVLFSLSVNEFRGTRSVQLMINDVRMSDETYKTIQRQYELYRNIASGNRSGIGAARIFPRYVEFADIYRALRDRAKKNVKTVTLSGLASLSEADYGFAYVKAFIILDVFADVGLIKYDISNKATWEISFEVIPSEHKTDLKSSALYQALKRELG